MEGYDFIPDPDDLPDAPVPDLIPVNEPESPRKSRGRKKRRPRTPQEAQAAEQLGDRILNRPDPEPNHRWWVPPAILASIGGVLAAIALGIVAYKLGAKTGLVAVGATAAALLFQIVFVTILLTAVGTFFGIEYGPIDQALVKLAAVLISVDGLSGLLTLGCTPLGLMMAAILGAGAFQYMFRLATHEMLLSVAGMVLASWVLNAAVFAIVMSKPKKEQSAPTTVLVSPAMQMGTPVACHG